MRWKRKLQTPPWAILAGLWIGVAGVDLLWFALDRRPPSWDPADYLNGVTVYWQALQTPEWLSLPWWEQLWQLSSKIPPLTYILAGPLLAGFGAENAADGAARVLLVYVAVLLAATYGLGALLFGRRTGLWAAALCAVLPGLYRFRTEFVLDVPVAAMAVLCLYWLTAWRESGRARVFGRTRARVAWRRSLVFGVCFGLALLVKQTIVLFLSVPLLAVTVGALWRREWERLGQLLAGGAIATLVAFPWYRTNWLLVLTGSKRATVDAAIAEGDPALTTPEAWLYYLQVLPLLLSVPLVAVPLAGWGLAAWRRRSPAPGTGAAWRWLGLFLLGGYGLCSLNINKDARYILPLLPVLAVLLARGLQHWGARWRWGTLLLAALLMGLNLFAGETVLAAHLSPRVARPPHPDRYPHAALIEAVTERSPYLQATLAVVPSTGAINQHNVSFYGALADFHVYGRQVGTRESQVRQDARSLDWFLTAAGEPESGSAARTQLRAQLDDEAFETVETWSLPDGDAIALRHRRVPRLEVAASTEPCAGAGLCLPVVTVPVAPVPPGQPLPVTYEWLGGWSEMREAIALLSWHRPDADPLTCPPQRCWLHDRGVVSGYLHATGTPPARVRAIERIATLPPADLEPGEYVLSAVWVDRATGTLRMVPVPEVTIAIAPEAEAIAAPELDLPTQLRQLALQLPEGEAALEGVFAEIARINQYDPNQVYLQHLETALNLRLNAAPERLDRAYAVALANVLQRDARGAIASFERVTALDSNNPNAYAYLAFVNLYDWRGRAAREAIAQGLALAPDDPTLHALDAIAGAMSGNLVRAWQAGERYLQLQQ